MRNGKAFDYSTIAPEMFEKSWALLSHRSWPRPFAFVASSSSMVGRHRRPRVAAGSTLCSLGHNRRGDTGPPPRDQPPEVLHADSEGLGPTLYGEADLLAALRTARAKK